jgi:metabolite-proton symporter
MTKVALATLVGTSIEWYDFFLYGTASALIFGKLFFPDFNSAVGTILAFGTFAIGYLARPLGAVVFGHFGDRVGRKSMLATTLLIMGLTSTVIGVLPTYDQIGVWAPLLLIALRLLQGFGVGGEWGAAVLVAVEEAPPAKRGFYGTFPQLGVPVGLLLSTGVFSVVSALPQRQFETWGWRIPFLLSAVLVVIGILVRLHLTETAVFEETKQEKPEHRFPLIAALRQYPKNLLLALGTRFATDITFNVVNVFVLTYATTELHLPRSLMLHAIIVGSAVELVTLPLFGALSDRIGRRAVYSAGAVFVALYGFVFFALVETRQSWLVYVAYILALAVSQASVYAVQSAMFSELFDTQVRYTGASLPYQFGGIITSGPAPLIAGSLFAAFDSPWPIAGYIAITAVISLVCVYFMKETRGEELTAPSV